MVVLALAKTNTLKFDPLAPKAPRTRAIYKRQLSKHTSDRVVELYQSGLSTREVAAKLEVSKTAVLGVLKRAGVVMRPSSKHY